MNKSPRFEQSDWSETLKYGINIYMLGAKRRFGQSTDCPAQSMDLRFAQPIHGLFSIQTRVSERSFPAAIDSRSIDPRPWLTERRLRLLLIVPSCRQRRQGVKC